MYIRRLIVKDCPNTPDVDFTFWNEWTGAPLQKILLTGPNGSGKTTLLRLIAELWDAIPKQIKSRPQKMKNFLPSNVITLGFAAMEIVDLFDRPVWSYLAKGNDGIAAIKSDFPDSYFIGTVYTENGQPHQYDPTESDDWTQTFLERMERLDIGSPNEDDYMPNLSFFEPEERNFIPTGSPVREIKYEPFYRWFVSYQTVASAGIDIETMFRYVKIRDPQQYRDIVNLINQFWTGKTIIDFDSQLRLKIQIGDSPSQAHFVNELSSGERQILTLMFMVARWMFEGGIVLIDEPDLHLHTALQRHVISQISTLVTSRQGQLIVASHSEVMWNYFDSRESFDLILGALSEQR